MANHYMTGMFPYFEAKLPAFYALETRDWNAAAALEPVKGAAPETQTQVYWARAIAAGHLHRSQQAERDLQGFDDLIAEVKQGRHAYTADSTGVRIERGEMLAWAAFATGHAEAALQHMRASADLQDTVGQGEVDIPAREMLADMLLELGRPGEALAEYRRSLQLSPNRFNGLFNAGTAAEAAGERTQAMAYYTALLQSTNGGADTGRPEIAHAKDVVASGMSAAAN